LATDTATPENTTSGGLIWSAPTTTWDVSDLGPKSWWRAQYYYRARWYSPSALVFLERDSIVHGASVSDYTWMLSNSPNVLDSDGREPSSDIDYTTYSGEDLDASNRKLQSLGLNTTGRQVSYYWFHGGLRLRFGVSPNWTITEPVVRDRIQSVEIGHGGWGWGKPWDAEPTGESLRQVHFGVPDMKRPVKQNTVLQRIRLFQVEKIIDRFADDWPHIMNLDTHSQQTRVSTENNEEFDEYYRRAHREATRAVVANWSKFGITDKGFAANVLEALFTSLWVLSTDLTEELELQYLDTWVWRHYGRGSSAGRPSEVYPYPGKPIEVILE
ncbi:MAG: hypothetical protein DRJ61_19345, partial [Acidobacteria bacterium]